ncbi:hypothetical protein PV05_09016 [Exophiala xenobiotica]|uniref:Uncharacterized protein n=1 Tax=Exophiala xenobiotica TaxID=348802 RepID=A0A0D2EDK7_9EURO|nr:uncharacterized protein PV05_09016 [Exophiala xenobiotica]KIW53443.1 hypothetical protein PV05_09016 [Exophiala xenobiotica]
MCEKSMSQGHSADLTNPTMLLHTLESLQSAYRFQTRSCAGVLQATGHIETDSKMIMEIMWTMRHLRKPSMSGVCGIARGRLPRARFSGPGMPPQIVWMVKLMQWYSVPDLPLPWAPNRDRGVAILLRFK